MSAAAVDLAVFLEAQIAALTQGTNLFINFMPDTPDEVVSLYSIPGTSLEGQLMGGDGKNTFENTGIEVITRAGAHDFPTANTTAELVRDTLQTISNQMVNSVYYMRVEEETTISLDGTDVQDRIHLRNTFTVRKYLS